MSEQDGRYYADGRAVFKRPLATPKADGSKSITMGFLVCRIGEFVSDDAAPLIAAALNQVEFGEPVPAELLS